MNIQHLREFVLFSHYLNYSRAAKESYVATTTLSEHIKALETEMGVSLVSKRSDTPTLTIAGELLVEESSRLFDLVDDITQHCKTVAENSINIVIWNNGLITFERKLLQAKRSFIKKYPDVHIQLSTVSKPSLLSYDLIESRYADLIPLLSMRGLGETRILGLPSGANSFYLYTEECLFWMTDNNRLYNKPVIDAKDMEGASIVTTDDDYTVQRLRLTQQLLQKRGVNITIKCRPINDFFEYAMRDLEQGFGLMIHDGISFLRLDQRDDCRVFRLSDLHIYQNWHVVYRSELDDAGLAYVEELKATADEQFLPRKNRDQESQTR